MLAAVRCCFGTKSLGFPDDLDPVRLQHDWQALNSHGIACFPKRFASVRLHFPDILSKSLGIPDDLLMWAPASLSRVTIFCTIVRFLQPILQSPGMQVLRWESFGFSEPSATSLLFFAATGWLITISLVFPDDLPPLKR